MLKSDNNKQSKPIESLSYQIAELSETDQLNDELVAVITAAIAASLNRSIHSIVVRSIRIIADSSPVWNRAARRELTIPWF
jgi:Tol biopolymer transport system component